MIGVYLLIAFVLGGFLSRLHGGGWGISRPRVVSNVLLALPFASITAMLGLWWLCAAAFLLSLLGVATGCGNGQDMGHWTGVSKPEKLEYLILWLKPHMSPYNYDALLCALCGIAMVSGAILTFLFLGQYYSAAAIMVWGGGGKAAAYAIGWRIFPTGQGDGPRYLSRATEIGEFLSGGFSFVALFLAYLLMN